MEGKLERANRSALHQHCEDRVEVIVGELFELVVGAVLHRVGNKHEGRVDTERLGPCGGAFDELGSGDADGWNATRFEIRHVMRTARNAGPSVGQSFDDKIDFACDLLPQRQWCRPGVGRLGVVFDRDTARAETLAEPAQKNVAARFGYVENPDREPVETLRPG